MQLQMRFEEKINKQLTFPYISYVFIVWNLVSETEERSELWDENNCISHNISDAFLTILEKKIIFYIIGTAMALNTAHLLRM